MSNLLRDIKSWNSVDKWVADVIETFSVLNDKKDTLVYIGPVGDAFGELAKSVRYESGNRGENPKINKNDCLIHSLLSCLSENFRRIQNDISRNVVAAYFRRKLLPFWIAKGLFNLTSPDNLLSTDFLTMDLGEHICKKLGINVLWMQPNDINFRFEGINVFDKTLDKAVFANNKSDHTIGIYGNNTHYVPLKLSYKKQNNFIIRDFDGESYINTFNETFKDNVKLCPIDIGAIVIYKGRKWKVISSRWVPRDKGEFVCNELDIEDLKKEKGNLLVPIGDVKLKADSEEPVAKICSSGKELSPITNRCVKICQPGFKRNDVFKCVKDKKPEKKETRRQCPPTKPNYNPKTKHCIKSCSSGKKRNNVTFKCIKIQKNRTQDVKIEPLVKVEMFRTEWYCIPEISPPDFIRCCRPIYDVLEEKNASNSSEDPFLKAVLMGQYSMSNEQWKSAEKARLKQKVLEMKMGDFHEELMGKFPEYETLPTGHSTGCDVQKKDGSVIIEVKNRDNTVKGSDGKHIITLLKKHREAGKKAIFVQINCPKGKVNRFGASAEMDIWNGRQVYAFLSGREDFFDDLQKTIQYVFNNYKSLAELKTALEIV